MNNQKSQINLEDLKRSLDSLPRGILITDCRQDDDPIVYANQFFLDMSGYTQEEVIGRNCRFMQGDDTEPEAIKNLSIAIKNHAAITVKMTNYKKTGEKFINEFTVSPVKNQAGEITHCIAIEKAI